MQPPRQFVSHALDTAFDAEVPPARIARSGMFMRAPDMDECAV